MQAVAKIHGFIRKSVERRVAKEYGVEEIIQK
jgi:hypothetical protein